MNKSQSDISGALSFANSFGSGRKGAEGEIEGDGKAFN
jgi:hypothetical protein